ncbi:GTP pyrophosphokinase family protein [Enterococcus sp. BWM-S5]|uniref:GTP pyrophosphokinase family protein n=1 Tax=Enterococcus larvae TaxID=2794352 RepID=A0ABS4CLU9_9ENTE|nr:GTP pyrophosphokinase family protein [Enterococcus larvae]MBP1046749.1 GTP pyrophosphokinase family protein [Enterococcus larvae]
MKHLLPQYQMEIQNAQFFFECVMKECETKFSVLLSELSLRNERTAIQRISSRVKSNHSIYEKCRKKNIPVVADTILKEIFDGAGVRIICSYIDDVYRVREMFLGQDDVVLLKEKNYIEAPKENGYRSLHLVVQIPVFLSNMKENVNVEVQIRTAAMDFWANLEHELKYKNEYKDRKLINELKQCSEKAHLLDKEMLLLREKIMQFNHSSLSG